MMQDENEGLHARLAWFETYVSRAREGVQAAPEQGIRYGCPCCGYPTLTERGNYEICSLCHWEDDGQDNPRADERWGGPNGNYSLTEARLNFSRYLTMYDPDRPYPRIGGADSAVETQAKRIMMAAFDAMPAATDQAMLDALWQRVYESDEILYTELQRRVSEYETQVKDDAP